MSLGWIVVLTNISVTAALVDPLCLSVASGGNSSICLYIDFPQYVPGHYMCAPGISRVG